MHIKFSISCMYNPVPVSSVIRNIFVVRIYKIFLI